MSQRRTACAPAMTITINNHNNRCDATENCIKYISGEGEWEGERAGRKHNLLWFRHCFVGTCAPRCVAVAGADCSHPETSNYKSTEFHLNRLQLVPSRVWLWTHCRCLHAIRLNLVHSIDLVFAWKPFPFCLSPNTTSVQKPFVSLNRMYAFAIRGFSTTEPTNDVSGWHRVKARERKNTITHHIVFCCRHPRSVTAYKSYSRIAILSSNRGAATFNSD